MADPVDLQSYYYSPQIKQLQETMYQQEIAMAPQKAEINNLNMIAKGQEIKKTGLEIGSLLKASKAQDEIQKLVQEKAQSDPAFTKLPQSAQMKWVASQIAPVDYSTSVTLQEKASKLSEQEEKAADAAAKLQDRKRGAMGKVFTAIDPNSPSLPSDEVISALVGNTIQPDEIKKIAGAYSSLKTPEQRADYKNRMVKAFESDSQATVDAKVAKVMADEQKWRMNFELNSRRTDAMIAGIQARVAKGVDTADDRKEEKRLERDRHLVTSAESVDRAMLEGKDPTYEKLKNKVEKAGGFFGQSKEDAQREFDQYVDKTYNSKKRAYWRQLSPESREEQGITPEMLKDPYAKDAPPAKAEVPKTKQESKGPITNVAEVKARAAKDPKMEGNKLGEMVPGKGLKVFDKDGKLIGYYK